MFQQLNKIGANLLPVEEFFYIINGINSGKEEINTGKITI